MATFTFKQGEAANKTVKNRNGSQKAKLNQDGKNSTDKAKNEGSE